MSLCSYHGLARVLPAAADGDYLPLQTPTTELEQMQIFAEQMLRVILQNPEIRQVMAQYESDIRELANLDHRAMQLAAARLAGAH